MASIKKRGKTWYVRFSKRETQWDPKKQKNVSILKQKSKGGFKTKAEAQQYGIKMEAASLSGVDVIKNPVFADYYKKWYETYKFPSLSPATKNRYKINHKFIKNYFNDIKIKDITREQYQRFINSFAKDHAISTVRKLNISIKACINYAVDDGLLNKNFTNHISISGNPEKERQVEYLNLKEIKQLVKSCKQELNPQTTTKYLILAAIYTGARLGELSALQWSDINFENNTISITKSWNSDRKDMRKPKTKASIRTIPVNSSFLAILKQLKANHTKFVFGTPTAKIPPTSNGVNKVLRSLLRENNMKKKNFHFHSLRHSHVAYLLSQGVDIYVISKRLGHADIGITLRTYAYLLDEFKNMQDKVILTSLGKL
ncbi:MAG: tyrosine-type recombinase/integrase [Lactobacillus sp.]